MTDTTNGQTTVRPAESTEPFRSCFFDWISSYYTVIYLPTNFRRILQIFLIVITVFLTACNPKIEKKPDIKKAPEIIKPALDSGLHQKQIDAEKLSLTRWLNSSTLSDIVPCVAVAAVKDGKIIYKHTIRCESKKQYQIASLTKTFTAISILQLAERNQLNLDDPVQKHLNVDFRKPSLNSKEITIRHLLTHTSGIVEDTVSYDEADNLPFRKPEQRYPAGLRFNYSNQGYNLLGYMIFEITGLSVSEYFSHNILKPLGMNETSAPAGTRGSAGITCSINDLAAYMIMLLNEGRHGETRIVSAASFREMLKETLEEPKSKNREYRGICWRVWTIDNLVFSFHHAAHMPGSGGYMQLFPFSKTGYVFIGNPPVYDREEFYSYYKSLKFRILKFSQLLIDDEKFKPLEFTPDRPSREQLAIFTGRYAKQDNSGRFVDVSLNPQGNLVVKKSFAPAERYVVFPISMRTFVYVYPGQSEKGELFDFIIQGGESTALGIKDGYYLKQDSSGTQ